MGRNERFLTYATTDLQLFKIFIAILCLNGVEQPFKRHQCHFFLPLRRGNPRLRRGSFRPSAPPPLDPRLVDKRYSNLNVQLLGFKTNQNSEFVLVNVMANALQQV